MLEEQLEASRKRAEQVVELEADILKYCSQINELHIVCYLLFLTIYEFDIWYFCLFLIFKGLISKRLYG